MAQTEQAHIKQHCRARVLSNLGRCIAAQLVVGLPLLLAGGLGYGLAYRELFGLLLGAVQSGVLPAQEQLQQAMLSTDPNGALPLFILPVLAGALHFGLQKFYLSLARGGQDFSLFDGLGSLSAFGASIRLELCLRIYEVMWSIPMYLVMLVLAFLQILGILPLAQNSLPLYALMTACVLPIWLAARLWLQSCSGAWVYLITNPKYSAMRATVVSTRIFKGQYLSLFGFCLSFVGWFALTPLLLGTGSVVCLKLYYAGAALLPLILCGAVFSALALVCYAFVSAYFASAFFTLFLKRRAERVLGQVQGTVPQDSE